MIRIIDACDIVIVFCYHNNNAIVTSSFGSQNFQFFLQIDPFHFYPVYVQIKKQQRKNDFIVMTIYYANRNQILPKFYAMLYRMPIPNGQLALLFYFVFVFHSEFLWSLLFAQCSIGHFILIFTCVQKCVAYVWLLVYFMRRFAAYFS